MMLGRGRLGTSEVLSRSAWEELARRSVFDQRYGLGWRITMLGEGGLASRMGHEGAITCFRSFLRVDLDSGHLVVLLLSVVRGERDSDPLPAVASLGRRLERLMDAIRKETGSGAIG
jgi:hypothetical protein